MRVPGSALVVLRADPQSTGNQTYEGPDGRGNRLVLFVPNRPSADLELSYTSYGSWYVQTGPSSTGVGGTFGFGVPTRDGDVPTSGTGTYAANITGDSGTRGYGITGQARLVFDFAAGTLSGHMQPIAVDGWGLDWDLGRYDFTNTVFGVGRTTFSGSFVGPGPSGSAPSFFEGRFTGPGATELMARWRAPFVDPYGLGTHTMQGIWLGKRE